MIIPNRKVLEPVQIRLDLTKIESYRSDDPELESERQTLIGEFNSLRQRIEACGEALMNGRIETLTSQRDAAIAALRENEQQQQQQQQAVRHGELTTPINTAAKRLSDTILKHRNLLNAPPEKSRTSDAELADYLEQLESTKKEVQAATLSRDRATDNWSAMGQRRRVLAQEHDGLEHQVKLIDYERGL